MITRKERLHQRNEKIRHLFHELSAKNPKWRIECVISEIAKRMFLSIRTIEAIIKGEGVYAYTHSTDKNEAPRSKNN